MNTKDLIIKVARDIFLEDGYKKANIRDIATRAEVSTGAIYGYFVNKEKLYEAAIGPLPKEYYYKYIKAVKKITDINYFSIINKLKQNHYDGIELYLDYVYADIIAWKLVINGEGTNYHKHLDSIVTKEVKAFNDFLNVLDQENVSYVRPNENVVKILIQNLINDLVAIIKYDMNRDEAYVYARQIADFFYHGWINILELDIS